MRCRRSSPLVRAGRLVAAVAVGLVPPSLPAATQAQTVAGRIGFDADVHPPAPDYGLQTSWAVRPGHLNLSEQEPAGATPAMTPDTRKVDVFYIQPTTLRSAAHWNQAIDDADTNAWTDVSVIARQASIFNACCRLFAPRYRQAGTGALGSHDGDLAYDLAYGDVKRAFQFYLAHDNGGRPFMLAGHSQGALHIYRLVAEFIDGQPLQAQFVAAYAIGVPASLGVFGSVYRTVRPCLKPLQTGCIVSWNSFSADADPSSYISRPRQAYVKRYTDGPGEGLFCINPLTFDADQPAGGARLDTGALPGPVAPGPLPPLVASAVGAVCRNGVLMVEGSSAARFVLAPLPGGSLHMQDLDLFYEPVRDNAIRRAERFLSHPPVAAR